MCPLLNEISPFRLFLLLRAGTMSTFVKVFTSCPFFQTPPPLPRSVASPHTQVEENSWVLHKTILRLTGQKEMSIDAVLAPFSPPPAESVLGPVVLAVPSTADTEFENATDIRGRCVLLSCVLSRRWCASGKGVVHIW